MIIYATFNPFTIVVRCSPGQILVEKGFSDGSRDYIRGGLAGSDGPSPWPCISLVSVLECVST